MRRYIGGIDSPGQLAFIGMEEGVLQKNNACRSPELMPEQF